MISGSSVGEFDRPIGITTTEQGEVLVADTWNHRLQVFDLEGNFIRTIGKRGTGSFILLIIFSICMSV